MMDAEEHGQLKALAWRTLKAVDHIDAKVADEGLMLSPEWRAWRAQVRAVIRGERMDIPEEPPRYIDGATAYNPAAIFKSSWQDLAPAAPAQPTRDERDDEIDALRKRIAELEAAPKAAVLTPIVEPSEPPPEVLAEALPDEDHAELKQRLLVELGSLRNMLVGNIPLTAEDQTRKLERLAALEHPTILNWLQG